MACSHSSSAAWSTVQEAWNRIPSKPLPENVSQRHQKIRKFHEVSKTYNDTWPGIWIILNSMITYKTASYSAKSVWIGGKSVMIQTTNRGCIWLPALRFRIDLYVLSDFSAVWSVKVIVKVFTYISSSNVGGFVLRFIFITVTFSITTIVLRRFGFVMEISCFLFTPWENAILGCRGLILDHFKCSYQNYVTIILWIAIMIQ